MAMTPFTNKTIEGNQSISDWLNSNVLERLLGFWWLFFLLCAIEGAYALVRLALIPVDPKNQILLGYSGSRLLMMGCTIILTLIFISLAIVSWHKRDWRQKYLHPLTKQKLFTRLLIPAGLLALLNWGTLFILRLYPEKQLFAFYERFEPLLSWLCLIGLQALIWLTVLRYGVHGEGLHKRREIIITAMMTMGIFLIGWMFITWTKIGITADAVAWGPPGVPVLEWQIWFGWVLGIMLIVISIIFSKSTITAAKIWPAMDILLIVLIYAGTVFTWLQQPVPRSYFAPQVRPPNFEIYPYSDAANHDIAAQHILIGDGFFNGKVVKRPLLSVYFAGLHLIAGQDYNLVIFWQTLLLATLPVILYLLGKALHSRTAGLVMAIFALFRELNTIAATPFSRVSHSKLLLSDLPAAVGVCLFCWLAVLWLQKPRQRTMLALLAGGVLGALMLIRTQSIMLIGVPLLVVLFSGLKKWREWLPGVGLLALGITLCITPWIARNYTFTGRVVFDQMEQTGIFAQRYSDLPGYAMPEQLPDETEEAYAQRLLRSTWDFTLKNPGAVVGFIAAHFINNEIDTALVMPIRDEVSDLKDVFTITGNFWDEWDGNLRPWQAVLLVVNLVLIAIGIGGCFKRWGILGLLPLITNLLYSLSNAIVRNSGWRYILPADWIGYFYYTIGLIEVAISLLVLFGMDLNKIERILLSHQDEMTEQPKDNRRRRTFQSLMIGLAILCVGSTLPLVEVVFPEIYPSQTKSDILSLLRNQESVRQSGIDIQKLEQFAMQDEVVVARGRTLYPRFYDANAGESGYGWVAYEPRDYARMGFLIIGASDHNIIFSTETPPQYFPNASDVIVIGCKAQGQVEEFVDAVVVTVLDGNNTTYIVDGFNYQCRGR